MKISNVLHDYMIPLIHL